MADDIKAAPSFPDRAGYRRPPAGKRFRKGRSGNPAGRPKGSRNRPKRVFDERLDTLILEEAYRLVDAGAAGNEAMPVVKAVLRSLVDTAAKGDPRAQAVFLKLVGDSQADMEERQHRETAAPPDMGEPITIRIIDPPYPKVV